MLHDHSLSHHTVWRIVILTVIFKTKVILKAGLDEALSNLSSGRCPCPWQGVWN